jgi:D-alanine-D-alanine ligase-like ATP-grasp enzyme
VSHPSLGLPPSDPTAGLPDAAGRIRTNEARLAARALRVAMDADATIERRYDETGLRYLLRDAELLAERVAVSVETDRPDLAREYAEWTAPVYRRRGVSMDDVVALCEGLREAFPSVLAPGELPAADAALDEAIKAYRWHRRIAGDPRHKNAFLQFLYKGG